MDDDSLSWVDIPRLNWRLVNDIEVDSSIGATQASVAYLLFTSGSTGRPKGALISQRGMINHLYAKIADLQITANDIIAQTAAVSFDVHIWQCLAALLVGGQTIVYDDDTAFEPARLLCAASDDGVTILETVPSLLTVGLDNTKEAPPQFRLRWMIATGEALSRDLCSAWLTSYPEIPLVNAYGPTECSDDVTHHIVREIACERSATVPIGTPVVNTAIYVLRSDRTPATVGEIGEIAVSGVGVGLGYLGDPQRTASIFVPDTIRDGGGRMYMTGDLGRMGSDGVLEYLGRADDQVKIRGQRIELGEIEAALRQHTAVGQVSVIAHGEGADKRLIAYVVPKHTEVTSDAVREHARSLLPLHMIPSHVILLDRLPITPNGKLDRLRLPRISREQAASTGGPILTPMQAKLATIWRECLANDVHSLEDDFFQLGGSSLTAVVVISRIREAFGCEATLTDIVRYPTLGGLAGRIEQRVALHRNVLQ